MGNCKYHVEERTNKEGKKYYMLILEFDSGYICELLITNEKYYCITH